MEVAEDDLRPGLLALAALSLVFCALAIRRMQIRYESS